MQNPEERTQLMSQEVSCAQLLEGGAVGASTGDQPRPVGGEQGARAPFLEHLTFCLFKIN